MPKKDFSGKIALITGGSRGIGLETARELARRGAKIAIAARGKERLESARKALASYGHDAISIPADVSSPDDCQNMIAQTVAELGRLDILINNAGVSMRANMEDLAPQTCRKIVDINLLGSVYPTLFAIPQLKQNKGSVVYISSIAGIIGLPTATLYCATKRALTGLADSLRCELAPAGVHVGVVYVGFTENAPDKTVFGAGSQTTPHDRPSHMTQKEVAARIAALIAKRQNRAVLTPAGKFASLASRLSPELVEKTIIFGRKNNLGELLGMR